MLVLAMTILFGIIVVASPLAWRWSRDRQVEARRQRRYRRIGFQRAWNWLMRPRAARLTDQRNGAE